MSILLGLEGLALGGCPINAIDLGRILRERGHQVNVFAIDELVRVSLLPYAEKAGFSVRLLPIEASHTARAWQIKKLVTDESAEIVHVFAPWLGSAAAIAATSREPQSAVVTNWMMENVSYSPQRTPMILGTKRLQEEAQRTHRARVWLMEPPVDLEADRPDHEGGLRFRAAHGIGQDEVVVAIVSRIDVHLKAEGIGYAIQAVAQLDLPHVRLVVVGDGNAFEDIQRQALVINRRLGRDAVVLTGALNDPRPAYSGADLTLGMGGSAIRSLAHGTPLIVIGERGFAKVFEPATVDYFYEHGFFGDQPTADPVSHLAAQIRSVLPVQRRRALAEFGLGEAKNRFGLEASADKLEHIYRTTLESTPGPARRRATAAYLLARGLAGEVTSWARSSARTLKQWRLLRRARDAPQA